MKYIGILFYFIYRFLEKIRDRFMGFIIESYLKQYAQVSGKLKISGYGRFMCVSNLSIGNNVGINFGAYWVCEGGLLIGDNCRFAKNVTIYTRNHNYKGGKLPYDETNILKPVTIGKNVWVGTNVTILPGSKINDGAIIGAGAVVFGEIPAGAIVGAAGTNTISSRDMDHYYRLDFESKYNSDF